MNLENLQEGAGRIVGVSRASDNLSIKTAFKAGDVLFGKLRPYLRKYAQAKFDGVCTTEIMVFRANERVDPGFLFRIVSSTGFVDHNVAVSFGTKMPRTDWRTAGDFHVLLPPPVEQYRIATILAVLDEQIEKTEALVTKRELVLSGLIDELLIHPARTAKLGDYAEIGPSSKTPAASGQVPFLPMDAVSEDGMLTRVDYRPWHSVSAGFTRFAGGDVLVAKITPCFENGKGAHVPGEATIWAGSTEFHVVRAKANTSPRWLYWHTRAREFREKGAMQMSGSAGQQRVPRGFLENFPACDRSMEAQESAAEQLDAIQALLISEKRLLTKLRLQKDGLMRDLLTGAVRA